MLLFDDSFDNEDLLTMVFDKITLSVIHSESRKTEKVTMKANFIYFWSVKSEFVIKNSIFLDVRVSVNLAFFEIIGLFLSTLVLATLVTKNWGSV